jgi:hypothetical protein
MKKLFATSLALSFLALPLTNALAYPPPCSQGDVYVGGSTQKDSNCIPRGDLKQNRSLGYYERAQMRNSAREIQNQTRRTVTREIYQHRANTRKPGQNGYQRSTEKRTRRYIHGVDAPEMTTVEQNLRELRVRGHSAATRQDRSPRARATNRQRRATERANALHSRLRDRTGR